METLNLGSRSRRSTGAKDPNRDSGSDDRADGDDADTSTLDKDEGNILMSIISQRESRVSEEG